MSVVDLCSCTRLAGNSFAHLGPLASIPGLPSYWCAVGPGEPASLEAPVRWHWLTCFVKRVQQRKVLLETFLSGI